MVRLSLLCMSGLLIAAQSPAKAQSPVPAWSAPATASITSEEITFLNAGARLSGTLYRPAKAGRFPTVVVLHDASTPLGNARLYDHLKTMLPRLGIAVFTFDRRGTGKSTGETSKPFQILADDGIAAAKTLQTHANVDARRIGFWGLSQGGWLTLLAASRWPETAFAISVSAPITTPDVQMNYYTANILRIRGFSEQDVAEALAARKARDEASRGTLDIAAARARIQKVAGKPWFEFIYLNPEVPEDNVRRWAQEMRNDPLQSLEAIRAPTLILFGSADPVVPVAASVEKLASTKKQHPNVEVAVIAGADHSMMTTWTPRQQVDPALRNSKASDSVEYFGRLAAWLQAQGLVSTK